jgi:hypothetical protein
MKVAPLDQDNEHGIYSRKETESASLDVLWYVLKKYSPPTVSPFIQQQKSDIKIVASMRHRHTCTPSF